METDKNADTGSNSELIGRYTPCPHCGEETDGSCCTVTVDCDGTHIDDECKLRDCKNAQYHCGIRRLKPVGV